MVSTVFGPSVAIRVVVSAQSAIVSARAPSETSNGAMAQATILMADLIYCGANTEPFAEYWRTIRRAALGLHARRK